MKTLIKTVFFTVVLHIWTSATFALECNPRWQRGCVPGSKNYRDLTREEKRLNSMRKHGDIVAAERAAEERANYSNRATKEGIEPKQEIQLIWNTIGIIKIGITEVYLPNLIMVNIENPSHIHLEVGEPTKVGKTYKSAVFVEYISEEVPFRCHGNVIVNDITETIKYEGRPERVTIDLDDSGLVCLDQNLDETKQNRSFSIGNFPFSFKFNYDHGDKTLP